MTNYVRSFYISKVPFLPFLRPIPKANKKNAATDDLENAKRQQEIENR